MKWKSLTYILIFSLVMIIGYCQSRAAVNTFFRNLSVGMSGQDVLQLQQILNRYPDTQVALTGPGSPGQETAYFGPRTAQAVVRFQEKYSSEVLAPAGLSSGTGYVGSFTIRKLLALVPFPVSTWRSSLATSTTSVVTNLTTTASSQPYTASGTTASISNGVIPQSMAFTVIDPRSVQIFGLSHMNIRPGDLLSITGYGFDPYTVIHFGPSDSINFNATSTSNMTAAVPNLLYGKYEVWASNSRGTSQKTAKFYIQAGYTTDSRPMITSVSPVNTTLDSTITVTADGLSPSGNTIYSNLGIINNISSSDDRTISFKVADLPNVSLFFQNAATLKFPLSFSVGTQNGISLDYGYSVIMR